MLATMRPNASTPTAPDHTQVHSQASTSQGISTPRTSRASSAPHANPAPADSPVKLSTSAKKNRSSHGSKKTSKKAMQQQQQNGQQPDPIASNTPGLITLSRPVDVPATPSRSKKTPRKAAVGPAIDGAATDPVASDPALLSRSAPAGSSRRHTKATTNAEGDAPALTWQQQLLGAGAASAATPTRSKAAKKHAGTSKSTAAASDKSLTWQQELFNGKSPRTGPHFDVFADSRDAETFGGGSDEDVGVNGRKSHKARRDHQLKTAMGDLSLDDVFGAGQKPASARRNNSNNNKPGNTTHGSPVTPAKSIAMNANHHQHHLAKSSASDEIAYAGPDFHNSPSAASLPAPQFMRQKDHCVKPTSALGANVTTSSDDDDEAERQRRRQDRGTTAPPALQPDAGASSGVSKSATIENLLAQMMGSAG